MKKIIKILLEVTAIIVAYLVSMAVWFWWWLFTANYPVGIRIGVGLAVIGILSFMIYIVWGKLRRLDKSVYTN